MRPPGDVGRYLATINAMIRTYDDLIAFLHRFHEPWGDHRPSESIPDDLPKPLHRLYSEFGSLLDMDGTSPRLPFATQDGVVSTKYLKRIDNMYEFAWENQGNWSCRTPIVGDDPPVYSNSRDVWEDGPSKGHQLACDSLEHFLTTLCLQEAVMGCPNLIAIRCDDVAKAFSFDLRPVWLNGIFVDGDPSHDFYECPGTGILAMTYGGGWVGSHSDDISAYLNPETDIQRISQAR